MPGQRDDVFDGVETFLLDLTPFDAVVDACSESICCLPGSLSTDQPVVQQRERGQSGLAPSALPMAAGENRIAIDQESAGSLRSIERVRTPSGARQGREPDAYVLRATTM
ncbi:hypothetical protein ABFU82_06725 [Nocardioides sp. WV_118_6]